MKSSTTVRDLEATAAAPSGAGIAAQVEPDPSDLAARYGEATGVLDWRGRLVCSRCYSRAIDVVLTGAKPPSDVE